MLSIRLLRTGKKNQPFYRMVVTDKKNPPRGGRFLEIVGFLNPFTKEKDIKADRIKHWISVGAKPSDTVHNMLVKEKVIEGKKIALHGMPKKKAQAFAKASAGEAVAAAQVKAAEEAKATAPVAEAVVEDAPKEVLVEETPEASASESEKAE